MRLLVIGPSGQVGWELIRSLVPIGTVVAFDRRACDLSQPEQLRGHIRNLGPDVVINAAAYSAVDRAENEEQLATTVNGTAVGVMADECRAADALLIHYSTDYVFDGTKDAPYTEQDAPHPINAYGRSKLAGELVIRQTGCNYLIIRTSWVYAARGKNFVRTMLRLAQERDRITVVDDQYGAPNWARHIADATAHVVSQAVKERAEGSFASGTFNMTAAGVTTWFGFAETIMQLAAQEGILSIKHLPELSPITTEVYAAPAARPKNSRLAGDRLLERFGIRLPDWKDGVLLCLKELRNAAT